jgi:hypothetical protein
MFFTRFFKHAVWKTKTAYSNLNNTCTTWYQVTSSPVHSRELVQALASTVVLGFEPRRDPWPYFCSFQTFMCFWNRAPSSTWRGVWLLLDSPLLLRSDSAGALTHSNHIQTYTSMSLFYVYICVCVCKHEIHHCHYLISGYHSDEFFISVYERKLCTRSKPIYQYLYFASVYRVYSVNTDNTDVDMWNAVHYTNETV